MKVSHKLYRHRFEIFVISQMAVLFGSIVFIGHIFNSHLSQILFTINILAGIILISKNKTMVKLFMVLLGLSFISYFYTILSSLNEESLVDNTRWVIYFLFYLVVVYELIHQVYKSRRVNKAVIFGLMGGYISLGLIGYFVLLTIEIIQPNSFSGILVESGGANDLNERLMYFSYMTLLTIGYGDIVPVTAVAQKVVIVIGLIGQFYMIIITSIVVGKYINQKMKDEKD